MGYDRSAHEQVHYIRLGPHSPVQASRAEKLHVPETPMDASATAKPDDDVLKVAHFSEMCRVDRQITNGGVVTLAERLRLVAADRPRSSK